MTRQRVKLRLNGEDELQRMLKLLADREVEVPPLMARRIAPLFRTRKAMYYRSRNGNGLVKLLMPPQGIVKRRDRLLLWW